MADAELRHDRLTTAIRRHGWLLPALVLFAACQPDRPTSAWPSAHGLALAKGSGGGTTGGSTAPSVSATSPGQAPQDTTVDVTVTGSGFTTGARATWALNGDTTLVHVKATKVVSSTQLVATIMVPATAPVASYDVQVMLVDGKKGVGVELFAVTLGDPAATFAFPSSDATLGVRSDHMSANLSGDAYLYVSGTCAIDAKIFATTSASNSGDATLNLSTAGSGKRTCSRSITADLGGGVQSLVSFINVNKVQNTTDYRIPIGETQLRALNMVDSRCTGLRWRTYLADGTYTGADSVRVTRTSADTWLVETQPAPNDKALCIVDGRLYHIPVQFTVTTSRPLP